MSRGGICMEGGRRDLSAAARLTAGSTTAEAGRERAARDMSGAEGGHEGDAVLVGFVELLDGVGEKVVGEFARFAGSEPTKGASGFWPGAPFVRQKLFGYVHYYCLLDGLFRSCVVDSSNCPVAEQQHGLSGVRVIDDLFEAKRGQFIVECFRIHSSGVGRDYGGRWCSRSRCRGRHNGRSNRFGCDRGGRRHCCRCSNGCRGRLGNGMRDGWSCLRGSRAA